MLFKAYKVLEVLSSKVSEGEGELSVLVDVLAACPAPVLVSNFSRWSQLLTQRMRVRGRRSLCVTELHTIALSRALLIWILCKWLIEASLSS